MGCSQLQGTRWATEARLLSWILFACLVARAANVYISGWLLCLVPHVSFQRGLRSSYCTVRVALGQKVATAPARYPCFLPLSRKCVFCRNCLFPLGFEISFRLPLALRLAPVSSYFYVKLQRMSTASLKAQGPQDKGTVAISKTSPT